MVTRLALAAVLLVVAVVVAALLARRKPVAPPRDVYPVPRQLDRADFARPEAPWLVALFSSTVCESCGPMAAKVAALACAEVAVDDVDAGERGDLHRRYAISGLPTTVIVDELGVVRAAFVGQVSATDLWAAAAEVRRPGTTPEPDLGRF